jgi:adenosine/AMP kinase
MPTAEEVINHLKNYDPKEHMAAAIWSEDDVLMRAKQNDKKITKKQAQEIIDKIDNDHDATIGITWDTIDCYLGDLEDETED